MRPTTAASVGIAALLVTLAATTHADDKTACLDAHAESQLDRKAGRLRQARAALQICSRPVCPKLVIKDCTPWLSEVVDEQPSVVVSARDEAGQDTLDVRVRIDGGLVAERLDGNPIDIDPGEHVVRVELRDGTAIETHVILHAGEKSRALSFDFAPSPAPTVASPSRPTPPSSPAPPASRPDGATAPSRPRVPLGVWVLGGVAVAAGASFAAFGLLGRSRQSDLESTCMPHCSSDAVAVVFRDNLVADLSLGVSILAVGAATWIALTTSRPPAASRVTVGAEPRAGGASARVAITF
jgi:hypothetical protein